MQIDTTYARTLTDMVDFLRYIVSIYGKEIYKDKQRLFNLIADLYAGEERQKKLFRRAIIEDNMAQRIYELEKKTLSERKAMADAIASRFAENNFFPSEIGQKVILTFVQGLNLLLEHSWKQRADGSWEDNQGCIYSSDKKTLIKGNPRLSEVIIPDGITEIGHHAFCNHTTLTTVELPSSLYSIGSHAFDRCKLLSKIDLLYGIRKIGIAAFYDCISLQNIQIPLSVREISPMAFGNCISLKDIQLPQLVTKINKWSFQNCISLKNVVCYGRISVIEAFAFNNCCCLSSINIDYSTRIGMEAFGNCLMLNIH